MSASVGLAVAMARLVTVFHGPLGLRVVRKLPGYLARVVNHHCSGKSLDAVPALTRPATHEVAKSRIRQPLDVGAHVGVGLR